MRDLVRDPPAGDFPLPKWIDSAKILQIVDALNRGGADETDSDDDEIEE